MESGTFADFFAQIQGQSSIIAIMQLLGVLFAFTIVGMIYLRVRRGRVKKDGGNSSASGNMFSFLSQFAPTTSATAVPANADMPDLNMLLSTDDPVSQPIPDSQPGFTRQLGIISVELSDGKVVEATEMIAISRDRMSDNLVVQIGQYAYDGTEGGVHPDFRRRFVKLMREVSDLAPAFSQNFAAEPGNLQQPDVVSIQLSDGRVVDAAEMMVIARERVSDNLVVQIGQYAYDGTEDGVHPDFRRRFVKLMREVSDMAPALSKESNVPVQTQPVPPPLVVPSPTLAVEEPEQQAPLNLADQIELYLQQKLITQPEFAARGLHIHSAPDGGVRIEVDGQYFESVNDVEDSAVQMFLQQTIAEWQSKH